MPRAGAALRHGQRASQILRLGGCARPFGRPKEVSTMNAHPVVSSARSSLLASRASQMRAVPTCSEQLLWSALRGRRLGVGFRCQVPIGGRFIADLLAPAARLVVEVDGGYHERREPPMSAVMRRSSGSAIACCIWMPSWCSVICRELSRASRRRLDFWVEVSRYLSVMRCGRALRVRRARGHSSLSCQRPGAPSR